MKTGYLIKHGLLSVFVLMVVLFSNHTDAQKLFKHGYIVLNEVDTITGYIQMGFENSYFREVKFKVDLKSKKVRTYKAETIREYCFNGNCFQSAEVIRLDRNHIISDQKETVFLRKILDGSIILYEYKGKHGEKQMYLQLEPDSLIALGLKKQGLKNVTFRHDFLILPNNYRISGIEQGQLFEDNYSNKYLYDDSVYILKLDYIHVLRNLFYDCQSVQISPKLELSGVNIKGIIKDYSICKELTSCHIVNTHPWFQIAIIGYAGWSKYIKEKYGSNEYGFMVELRENMNLPHFSLTLGAGFYDEGLRYYESTYIKTSAGETQTDIYKEKSDISSWMFRFGYHFNPSGNLRPFLFAGFKFTKISYLGEAIDNPIRTPHEGDINFFNENIGGGIDFYFLRRNQLRIEAGWSGTPIVKLGYGFLIIK